MPVQGPDHLALTVKDLAQPLAFYTAYLGMQLRTLGDGRHVLLSTRQRDPDGNLIGLADRVAGVTPAAAAGPPAGR